MFRTPEPTRIGRFQILRTLGRGGQGEVYLAEDTQLKRRVAIKTLTLDGVAVTARVMDFGIAQAIQTQPSPDAPFVGSPAYMAPEYIDGKPYTQKSDLFAVGM